MSGLRTLKPKILKNSKTLRFSIFSLICIVAATVAAMVAAVVAATIAKSMQSLSLQQLQQVLQQRSYCVFTVQESLFELS